MAYDQRFAIGYISSSGAGGAELYRRHFRVQLENLAASGEYHEYHWMKALGTGEFPAIETALVDGDIAFRQHKEATHPRRTGRFF